MLNGLQYERAGIEVLLQITFRVYLGLNLGPKGRP
jgi:hypothetical protein